MSFSNLAWEVFTKSIEDYHLEDDVDAVSKNPYEKTSLEHLLYEKNWIDTVQWHLEDIIRDEQIHPEKALLLKRRIDKSNQDRTDMVEYVDSWFLNKYKEANVLPNARINTETPAWAVDRFSILALKIYHMSVEAYRDSASREHREKCLEKLNTLKEQHKDLGTAIDQLLTDIENGKVMMKVYKQMKMYNDESLNPVLYHNQKNGK